MNFCKYAQSTSEQRIAPKLREENSRAAQFRHSDIFQYENRRKWSLQRIVFTSTIARYDKKWNEKLHDKPEIDVAWCYTRLSLILFHGPI